VCRRAERLVVQADASSPINEETKIYLNRLSDLLFVLARWANKQAGVREDTWTPKEES
jgi:cob(I)alamin adenosyltransferase